MKKWILLAALVLIFSAIAVVVCAGELPRLAIEPLSAWPEIAPGGEYSGSFLVTNLDEIAVSLDVLLLDFILDDNGKLITLEPGTLGEQSLSPSITYSPEHVTLQPGESCNVNYWFSLPAEANGPHWATLVVVPEISEEVEPANPDTEEMAFIVRLHIRHLFIIVQRPPNQSEPAGEVMSMDVKGAEEEDGKRRVMVDLAFQNLTEGVLQCKVSFEIRDAQGAVMARYEIPQEKVVLPNMSRVFTHTFEGLGMPPGEYLILGLVDFGGDYISAGQYLATVSE